MKSKEINKKIDEMEDLRQPGTTGIPYIGWYWRDVDFDNGPMIFGNIPFEKIGFMENNKWGYEELTIYPTHKLFDEIKNLIIDSLQKFDETKDFTVFIPVYDKIQGLDVRFEGTILK